MRFALLAALAASAIASAPVSSSYPYVVASAVKNGDVWTITDDMCVPNGDASGIGVSLLVFALRRL